MADTINEEEIWKALEIMGISEETLLKYYPNILNSLGKPSQLNFSYREFNYWTEKGIIDIPKPESGQSPWSRLNLIEILWIRIAQELRKFNLPFNALTALKMDMFENTIDFMRNQRELILHNMANLNIDTSQRNIISGLLNPTDKQFEEFVLKNKLLFSFISGIVFEIILFNRSISLIVFKHHKNFCFNIEGLKNQMIIQKELDEIKKGSYLNINLRNIISEYFLLPELEKLNEDFGVITKEEKEIVNLIRDNQVKEINIKKDENEIITYTATSTFEIKDDQVTAIKRQLRMNEFNEVRLVLRNDKHIYIENKRKVKIRPDKTAQ